MTSNIKNKERTIQCRISEDNYNGLKLINMTTGMTFQDICNYLISQEVARFEHQYPGLREKVIQKVKSKTDVVDDNNKV